MLKGDKILLNTGKSLNHLELSYLEIVSDDTVNNIIPLPIIQSMLLLAQIVLPNQFITSNRAEVFNAVHDHYLKYQGRKSFENANQDLLSWVVMKYYTSGAKALISSHEWNIPYSLLKKLLPLMISEVNFS